MTNPFKPELSLEECLGSDLRNVRKMYRDVFDVYHKGGINLDKGEYCRLLVEALKTDQQLLTKVTDPDLCKTVDAERLRLRFRGLKDIDKLGLNSDIVCEKLIPYLQDQLVLFELESLRDRAVKLRKEMKSLKEALSAAKIETNKQKLVGDLQEKQTLYNLVQDNLRKSKFLQQNNKLELFTLVLVDILTVCNRVAPIPSKMFEDKQQALIGSVLNYFVEDTSDTLKLTDVAKESATKDAMFRSLDLFTEDGSRLDPRKVCLDTVAATSSASSPQLAKQQILLKGLESWVKRMSQLLNQDVSQRPVIASTLQQLRNNVAKLESGQVVDVKDSYEELNPDFLKEVRQLFVKKVNSYKTPIDDMKKILPHKKQRNALTAAYNQCVEEAKQLLSQQNLLRTKLPIPTCFDQIELALDTARQQVQGEDVVNQFKIDMTQHLETEESFATILSTKLGPQVSTQLQLSQLQEFVKEESKKVNIQNLEETRQRWQEQFMGSAIKDIRKSLSEQFLTDILNDVTFRNVDSDCADRKTDLLNQIVSCQSQLADSDGSSWLPCIRTVWLAVNGYEADCPVADTPFQVPSQQVALIEFRAEMAAYTEMEKKYIDILSQRLGDKVSAVMKWTELDNFVRVNESVSMSNLQEVQQEWRSQFTDNEQLKEARKSLSIEFLEGLLNQLIFNTAPAECDNKTTDMYNRVNNCKQLVQDSDGSSWLPCLQSVWKDMKQYEKDCPTSSTANINSQTDLAAIRALKKQMTSFIRDESENVKRLVDVLGDDVIALFNLDEIQSYIDETTDKLNQMEDKLKRNMFFPEGTVSQIQKEWESKYYYNEERHDLRLRMVQDYLRTLQVQLQSKTGFLTTDTCTSLQKSLQQDILRCQSQVLPNLSLRYWPICLATVSAHYRRFQENCKRLPHHDMLDHIKKERALSSMIQDILQLSPSASVQLRVPEMNQILLTKPSVEDWNKFIEDVTLVETRRKLVQQAAAVMKEKIEAVPNTGDIPQCFTEKLDIVAALDDCALNPDCLLTVYPRFQAYERECIAKLDELRLKKEAEEQAFRELQMKADKLDLEQLRREITTFKTQETDFINLVKDVIPDADAHIGHSEMVQFADTQLSSISHLLSDLAAGTPLTENTVKEMEELWIQRYGLNIDRETQKKAEARAYMFGVRNFLTDDSLDRQACSLLVQDLEEQIAIGLGLLSGTFSMLLLHLQSLSIHYNTLKESCLKGGEISREVAIRNLNELMRDVKKYELMYGFIVGALERFLRRDDVRVTLELEENMQAIDKFKSKIDKAIEKGEDKVASLRARWETFERDPDLYKKRHNLELEAIFNLRQRVSSTTMLDVEACQGTKTQLLEDIDKEENQLTATADSWTPLNSRVARLIIRYEDWRTECSPVGKPNEDLALMTKALGEAVDLYSEAESLLETCRKTKIDMAALKNKLKWDFYQDILNTMKSRIDGFQVAMDDDNDSKMMENRKLFYQNYNSFTFAMLGGELKQLVRDGNVVPGKASGVINQLKTICVEKVKEFEEKFKPVKITKAKLESMILENQCEDLTKDMQDWMQDTSDDLQGKIVYCFKPTQFSQMPDEGDRIGTYQVERKWSSAIGLALAPRQPNIVSRLGSMSVNGINFMLQPIYTLIGSVASLVRRGMQYLSSKLFFFGLVAALAMLILVSKDAMSIETYMDLSLKYGLRTVTVMIQIVKEFCVSNYSIPSLAVTLMLVLSMRRKSLKEKGVDEKTQKATETVSMGFFTKIIVPLLMAVCAVGSLIKNDIFSQVGDVLTQQIPMDSIKEFLKRGTEAVKNVATNSPDAIPLSWRSTTGYLKGNMDRLWSSISQFVPSFDIEATEMAARTAAMADDPTTVSFQPILDSYEFLKVHANNFFTVLYALYAAHGGDIVGFVYNIGTVTYDVGLAIVNGLPRLAAWSFNQVSNYFNLGIHITYESAQPVGEAATATVMAALPIGVTEAATTAAAAALPAGLPAITVSAVAQAPMCAVPTITNILANPCEVVPIETVQTVTSTIYEQGTEILTNAVATAATTTSSWMDAIYNIPLTSDILIYGLSIMGMLAGSIWIYKLLTPYFQKERDTDLTDLTDIDLDLSPDVMDVSDVDFVTADLFVPEPPQPSKPLPALPVQKKVIKPLPPLPPLPTPAVEVVEIQDIVLPPSVSEAEAVSVPPSTLTLTKNEFLTKVENQIGQTGCPVPEALRKPISSWDDSVLPAISSHMQCVVSVEPDVAKVSEELALLVAAKKAIEKKAVAQLVNPETGRTEGHVAVDGTVTPVVSSLPLASLPVVEVKEQTLEQLKQPARKMLANIVTEVLKSTAPLKQAETVELITVERHFPADFHFIWIHRSKVAPGDQVLARHGQQRLVYRYIPATEKIVRILSTNFDAATDTLVKKSS